ncbi:hypothetical protein HBH56_030490 [Parastagonospora nodorum]|uniref:Uncharacterized protein n=1 Tax=Phaeosphaeria nodorum (strain SN15 / ATCC MYA-4574 / FGSC 10173) TaxID=321614 RepID=A0A7U2I2E8_PHANO|nr:hypothetical protein HBH56_030490 [Parastagonospora nodorum]QRC99283.1 hypothetical protein JI435_304740 [Parastagonospora nodorum SN15]KAH3934386.1 hypothetical protein HBH54_051520 [Parastagonospora nodorum]KAH3984818.1 hypothetical protein HBH52_050370 [Parastagonospora nodorum]KAH4038875.1 hypothetical protein HBI09_040960 [Parastagonospora nodorum]
MESSVLSIPIRDIIAGEFSAHEAHPSFQLYTRWLETPHGSYIRRDPKAAFAKHPNVARVDCHSDLGECLLTSELSFADITKSKRELNELKINLEAQIQARHEDSSSAVLPQILDKRGPFGSSNYLITTHHKTYHDLGPENPSAGYQHYISWDLKCEKVEFSSSGFQLTSQRAQRRTANDVATTLGATLVGDADPVHTHGVVIHITFACRSIIPDKCCLNFVDTDNCLGEVCGLKPPYKERMECVSSKDVSKSNCASYHGGWCGVHIRQYQKNQGEGIDTSVYRFDVELFDGDQEVVGDYELAGIPSGQTKQFGSRLPMTFGIKAPDVDGDAVYMSYNGQSWGSNDQEHHCNFGKYDGGHRDGDCGFSC